MKNKFEKTNKFAEALIVDSRMAFELIDRGTLFNLGLADINFEKLRKKSNLTQEELKTISKSIENFDDVAKIKFFYSIHKNNTPSMLVKAAVADNVEFFKYILAFLSSKESMMEFLKNGSFNTLSRLYCSTLHCIIKNNSIEIMKLIFDTLGQKNTLSLLSERDDNSRTPLYYIESIEMLQIFRKNLGDLTVFNMLKKSTEKGERYSDDYNEEMLAELADIKKSCAFRQNFSKKRVREEEDNTQTSSYAKRICLESGEESWVERVSFSSNDKGDQPSFNTMK